MMSVIIRLNIETDAFCNAARMIRRIPSRRATQLRPYRSLTAASSVQEVEIVEAIAGPAWAGPRRPRLAVSSDSAERENPQSFLPVESARTPHFSLLSLE